MEVDLQELIKEGYDPTTMVIVTNSSRFKNIITSHKKNNQTRKLASLGDRYEKFPEGFYGAERQRPINVKVHGM